MKRKGNKRRFLKAFRRLFRRAKEVHLQIQKRKYLRARRMLEGIARQRDYRPEHKRQEAVRLLGLLGKIIRQRNLDAPFIDETALRRRSFPGTMGLRLLQTKRRKAA